jgi:hypothetical protein
MDIAQLNANIDCRITEVAGYQTNIDNYTLMLTALPKSWPAKLESFRGYTTAQLSESSLPDDDLMLVADLIFASHLRNALRAERIEQRKAALVLKVLQAQLPTSEV